MLLTPGFRRASVVEHDHDELRQELALAEAEFNEDLERSTSELANRTVHSLDFEVSDMAGQSESREKLVVSTHAKAKLSVRKKSKQGKSVLQLAPSSSLPRASQLRSQRAWHGKQSVFDTSVRRVDSTSRTVTHLHASASAETLMGDSPGIDSLEATHSRIRTHADLERPKSSMSRQGGMAPLAASMGTLPRPATFNGRISDIQLLAERGGFDFEGGEGITAPRLHPDGAGESEVSLLAARSVKQQEQTGNKKRPATAPRSMQSPRTRYTQLQTSIALAAELPTKSATMHKVMHRSRSAPALRGSKPHFSRGRAKVRAVVKLLPGRGKGAVPRRNRNPNPKQHRRRRTAAEMESLRLQRVQSGDISLEDRQKQMEERERTILNNESDAAAYRHARDRGPLARRFSLMRDAARALGVSLVAPAGLEQPRVETRQRLSQRSKTDSSAPDMRTEQKSGSQRTGKRNGVHQEIEEQEEEEEEDQEDALKGVHDGRDGSVAGHGPSLLASTENSIAEDTEALLERAAQRKQQTQDRQHLAAMRVAGHDTEVALSVDVSKGFTMSSEASVETPHDPVASISSLLRDQEKWHSLKASNEAELIAKAEAEAARRRMAMEARIQRQSDALARAAKRKPLLGLVTSVKNAGNTGAMDGHNQQVRAALASRMEQGNEITQGTAVPAAKQGPKGKNTALLQLTVPAMAPESPGSPSRALQRQPSSDRRVLTPTASVLKKMKKVEKERRQHEETDRAENMLRSIRAELEEKARKDISDNKRKQFQGKHITRRAKVLQDLESRIEYFRNNPSAADALRVHVASRQPVKSKAIMRRNAAEQMAAGREKKKKQLMWRRREMARQERVHRKQERAALDAEEQARQILFEEERDRELLSKSTQLLDPRVGSAPGSVFRILAARPQTAHAVLQDTERFGGWRMDMESSDEDERSHSNARRPATAAADRSTKTTRRGDGTFSDVSRGRPRTALGLRSSVATEMVEETSGTAESSKGMRRSASVGALTARYGSAAHYGRVKSSKPPTTFEDSECVHRLYEGHAKRKRRQEAEAARAELQGRQTRWLVLMAIHSRVRQLGMALVQHRQTLGEGARPRGSMLQFQINTLLGMTNVIRPDRNQRLRLQSIDSATSDSSAQALERTRQRQAVLDEYTEERVFDHRGRRVHKTKRHEELAAPVLADGVSSQDDGPAVRHSEEATRTVALSEEAVMKAVHTLESRFISFLEVQRARLVMFRLKWARRERPVLRRMAVMYRDRMLAGVGLLGPTTDRLRRPFSGPTARRQTAGATSTAPQKFSFLQTPSAGHGVEVQHVRPASSPLARRKTVGDQFATATLLASPQENGKLTAALRHRAILALRNRKKDLGMASDNSRAAWQEDAETVDSVFHLSQQEMTVPAPPPHVRELLLEELLLDVKMRKMDANADFYGNFTAIQEEYHRELDLAVATRQLGVACPLPEKPRPKFVPCLLPDSVFDDAIATCVDEIMLSGSWSAARAQQTSPQTQTVH